MENKMSCEKLKCGHPSCCEEDDQCGRPEHRYCTYCQAVDDGRGWEESYEELEVVNKDLQATLGKIMDRLKGPEAGLSEDLNQILRDKIQAAFEAKS